MTNPHLIVRLSVESRTLDILIFMRNITGHDGEGLTALQAELRPLEERTADNVVRQSGHYRLDAEGREDAESRHATAVFIAADTHQVVAEPTLQEHTDALLGFPGLAGIAI